MTAFLDETINMAAQYVDWLTPGDVAAVEAVAPGGAQQAKSAADRTARRSRSSARRRRNTRAA